MDHSRQADREDIETLRLFYSPAYVRAGHSFDTTRKSRWIAESLQSSPIAGVELTEPRPLLFDEVCRVHAPEYVRAVETGSPRDLAESQGFAWDPGMWSMVLASNGGVIDAALAALEHGVAGSLSSGLHHARFDHGVGFCTFNGLVIAVHAARVAGARSVLILDFDAHCGGGTASLIAGDACVRQVDVSVSGFDAYGESRNISLDIVDRSELYLDRIEQRLAEIEGHGFALCLYNAGMDPFEGCPIGGTRGITREILARRERLVFDWCRSLRLPVAFVLAGGYIGSSLRQETLVDLHRLTISAAAESA